MASSRSCEGVGCLLSSTTMSKLNSLFLFGLKIDTAAAGKENPNWLSPGINPCTGRIAKTVAI